MANILDSFDKIRSTLDRESITSIMNPFLILSIASTNWECLWTCPQLFSSSFVFRFQTIKVLNSNIIFKSKHLLVLKLFSNWDSNWFYSLFPIFDISSTIPIYYQIVIDPAHSRFVWFYQESLESHILPIFSVLEIQSMSDFLIVSKTKLFFYLIFLFLRNCFNFVSNRLFIFCVI